MSDIEDTHRSTPDNPGKTQQRNPAAHRRGRHLPRPQRPHPPRRCRAGRTTRRMGRITALPRPGRPQQITSRPRLPIRTGGHAGGADRLNHDVEESHDEAVTTSLDLTGKASSLTAQYYSLRQETKRFHRRTRQDSRTVSAGSLLWRSRSWPGLMFTGRAAWLKGVGVIHLLARSGHAHTYRGFIWRLRGMSGPGRDGLSAEYRPQWTPTGPVLRQDSDLVTDPVRGESSEEARRGSGSQLHRRRSLFRRG